MSEPDVSVIVPTYREAENLPHLVPRIHEALRNAGLSGEIVIVDDNSPDDTAAVCQRLAESHPLRLEVRLHERGLSTAVIHGLRLATGKILLVMDADLSHPPEKIPELISALGDPEVDFVIGSRYVPGASTDETWGLFRKLNSWVATLLARPLTAAKDPMAGFFALRRSTFESAAPLDPVGYKIGLELMVKCGCKRIKEVPITFNDRRFGASKLTLKEQLNYIKHLRRLYVYKAGWSAGPIQFGLVGSTGFVVDMACFTLFLPWLWLSVARIAAIWLAMSWNFYWNRRLTFAHARSQAIPRQYMLFCGSCSLGASVDWSISMILCRNNTFFGRHEVLAAMVGVASSVIVNFLLSHFVVFRRTSPFVTSPPANVVGPLPLTTEERSDNSVPVA